MAGRLKLITRNGCGLCDEAVQDLRRLGIAFEPVDVDADARLLALYDAAVPVLLLDGAEIARAPLDEATLRRALAGVAPAARR